MDALHGDAGQQAGVAENHVEELGKLLGGALIGVADQCPEAAVTGAEVLEPADDVAVNGVALDVLGGKLHGLLHTHALGHLQGGFFIGGDAVGDGKTVSQLGQQGGVGIPFEFHDCAPPREG